MPTSKKKTDGWAASVPATIFGGPALSNLQRHEPKQTNFEPYAYVKNKGPLVNINCVLRICCCETEIALVVRVLECQCKPDVRSGCSSNDIGLSAILWECATARLGHEPSQQCCFGRLEPLAMKTLPCAKQVWIELLRSDEVSNEVRDLYLSTKELEQSKNIVNLLKAQFLPTLPYSVDQLYCVTLWGRRLYFRIKKFVSQGSTKMVSKIFRLKSTVFNLTVEVSQAGVKKVQENVPVEPEIVGFSKVGGHEEIKKRLESAIVLPLTRPEKYFSLNVETGAKSCKGVRPPRGILLYGLPGTGKTFLMSAVAEEVQLRWKTAPDSLWRLPHIEYIDAVQILDSSTLTRVFKQCQQRFENENQQSLLIIDELDVLCPIRDSMSTPQAIEQVTTLLTHLDGSSMCLGTVIIGTTNRPEALDPAIRRPGRLDQEMELDVPNLEERISVLKKCAERLNVTSALGSEADTNEIGSNAHGFVPSDIEALFLKAVEIAQEEAIDIHSDDAVILTVEHMKSALPFIKPSGLRDFALEIPKTTWDDIGGYEHVKDSLKECVEWPIKYANLFSQLGLTAPRGILLYGPPGNSKTILAKAVASQAKMNFISVKGPEIFSKWLGDSEKTIRTIFRKARQHAPTVIFFDEIDALGVDRQRQGGGTGAEARVLSQILNEMDGIGASKQVIVIGATNRPDLLDSALMRPGRFDRLVYVSLPDAEARAKIFRIHLRAVSADEDLIKHLAETTSGYSGAEIAMICTEARMAKFRHLVKQGTPHLIHEATVLTKEDFDKIIAAWPPRTSNDLIAFYDNFNLTQTNKS
eukprot:Blabericola_migrator_1__11539@NODE_689_length_6864_cov_83_601000_g500_i0_p1_GENE_NODE_689_length_6864_cov_83_601000_g500_i0NODE_689_length_6864_cov_83_601000_g500_i0_p1_ORF_typecomplete_len808_score166_76AAA/PF00004_29/1_9e21AAA/PF00004_29/9_8e40RuvB_N/PF05496_12/5_1e05RuvB_N/PF05496_12/9_6e10AAA_22/PF13401_6/2_4e09AAA_22/PF13401_6/0_0012IstB_IS21/PF01695_17/2_2e07IstB_IS21/PF01695_17/0_0045AAA_5/PF07728_14/4_7e06AAA_5/PF07728_14/0_00079AFG1_ATPase/PF03969_16/3_4e06AFG1_ATPase/PF03969_16/0_0033A